MNSKRLLGMFAHPDDEVLGTGGAIARYAADGARVELICTTRGEAGEIADSLLATPETLASVREMELSCSAIALGVSHVTLLDFRDSGMEGTTDNEHPRAFMNAAADVVVPMLVKEIRRIRPHVIITFEPYGGYGHPDHIAINRHTREAFEAAANPDYATELGPAWQTPRLFYQILPISRLQEMMRRMEARKMDLSFFDQIDKRRRHGWPDERVHCVMDVSDHIEEKWAALSCHRTQFGSESLFRRLPEEEMKQIFSTEHFALAIPEPVEALMLPDLFHGLSDS